jgi:DNA modification methylase
MSGRRRTPTATSNFGVGRREAHDATAFYSRFEAPDLSDDDTVRPPLAVAEPFVCGDARKMDTIDDGTVALVVTSPPYFAGKVYEEELGRGGVPASYLDYLGLLEDVFADCVRVLEPGGRIAVNVANLGRKPYRSLAADVTTILQDRLRLLLRGEVVWRKGEGAAGSCAWGSYRSPANPVLRDTTERVILASKGRFDRARSAAERRRADLPHRTTMRADDFMAYTLDVWDVPPESARRVNHPAPFPVELPARLIDLYTYEDDLVCDPFMGSGSTLVAAALGGRRYVGYDTDRRYVELARARVDDALAQRDKTANANGNGALDAGASAADLATEVLEAAGFSVTGRAVRVPGTGLRVPLVATDRKGTPWAFDLVGPNAAHRGGLVRTDAVWRALGRASVLTKHDDPPILLTTALPRRPGEGDTALRAAGPDTVFDVVDLHHSADRDRLATYAAGKARRPLLGFWTERDLTP